MTSLAGVDKAEVNSVAKPQTEIETEIDMSSPVRKHAINLTSIPKKALRHAQNDTMHTISVGPIGHFTDYSTAHVTIGSDSVDASGEAQTKKPRKPRSVGHSKKDIGVQNVVTDSIPHDLHAKPIVSPRSNGLALKERMNAYDEREVHHEAALNFKMLHLLRMPPTERDTRSTMSVNKTFTYTYLPSTTVYIALMWPIALGVGLIGLLQYLSTSTAGAASQVEQTFTHMKVAMFFGHVLFVAIIPDSYRLCAHLGRSESESGMMLGIFCFGSLLGCAIMNPLLHAFPEVWWRGVFCALMVVASGYVIGMSLYMMVIVRVIRGQSESASWILLIVSRITSGVAWGIGEQFVFASFPRMFPGIIF